MGLIVARAVVVVTVACNASMLWALSPWLAMACLTWGAFWYEVVDRGPP